MTGTRSWLSLAGALALFATWGPAEASEEPTDSSCQPPSFVADLTPGAEGSDIRTFIDFNGMVLVDVHGGLTSGSSLWKLVAHTDPTTGVTGTPFPVADLPSLGRPLRPPRLGRPGVPADTVHGRSRRL